MRPGNKIFSLLLVALSLLVVTGFVSGCKSKTDGNATLTDANGQPIDNSASNGSGGTGGGANGPQIVRMKKTVEPGVDIHARIDRTIDAKTAQVGDEFNGVLTEALRDKKGDVVIARDTPVHGTVVSARNTGRFKGAGVLAIELSTIGNRNVQATEYVVSHKGKGKRTTALIGGGAAAGALIGGLTHGGKGALIGGLIGGGAGTAGAGLTGNKPLLIPVNSDVVFELSSPITIEVDEKVGGSVQ